ncbi:MAG: polysaccharide biosynthesis/export family protein [Leeuwenhoekiella sp.]
MNIFSKRKLPYSICLFGLYLLTACGTKKQVLYFQDLQEADQTNVQVNPVRIQEGDKLSIQIIAKDPRSVAVFNSFGGGSAGNPTTEPGLEAGSASAGALYQVDEAGKIELPELGQITAENLTLNELRDKIRTALLPFVDNPIVKVDITNFGVMVLGEVNRPGLVPVMDNKITIIEALAFAGDMTIKGERKNVQVLRTVDGKHITGIVDFTSVAVLDSPFYWLKQGDLINVPPNTSQVQSAGLGPGTSIILSSLVGIATVILTLFLRNN